MRIVIKISLILLAAVGLIVAILAAGYGPYRFVQVFVDLVGDNLEWQSRQIAWRSAVNCGVVEAGHDARDANDCALSALSTGRSFRVRYRVQTIDSDVSTGIVRSSQGRLYEIILEGNPGRGGPTSLLRQRTLVEECTTTIHQTSAGRLTCTRDRGF